MENLKISTHTELTLRIMRLRADKLKQEDELKNSVKEFAYNFNYVSIVKGCVRELTRDKEVQFDLTKVGLNIGAKFIIDKVFGRNNSMKGFINSILIEKLSTSFINTNASKIISVISNLLHGNTGQKTDN